MLPEISVVKFMPIVPGSPLSYDHGLAKRQHRGTGMEVFMVKRQPGTYYNAFGKELPEVVAKEAGFDTLKYAKERKRRELMEKATEEIRAQLEQEMAESPDEHTILREKGGYKVVDMNLGRAQLRDPDGNNLLPLPVPHEQALALMEKLVLDTPKEE